MAGNKLPKDWHKSIPMPEPEDESSDSPPEDLEQDNQQIFGQALPVVVNPYQPCYNRKDHKQYTQEVIQLLQTDWSAVPYPRHRETGARDYQCILFKQKRCKIEPCMFMHITTHEAILYEWNHHPIAPRAQVRKVER